MGLFITKIRYYGYSADLQSHVNHIGGTGIDEVAPYGYGANPGAYYPAPRTN